MDQSTIDRNIRLESIFMPHSRKQRDEMLARQTPAGSAAPDVMRFAHYTTAEAALNILRTKRIWMRNTTCMSDYREVQHGFSILQTFFDDAKTKAFTAALDSCFPGAATQAIENFNNWWRNNLSLNIFVASMAEHESNEDAHGRLSMWRAFGTNSTRVAIVLGIPRFTDGAQALGISFSPVAYLTKDEMHAVMTQVIANVTNEGAFLQTLSRDLVVNFVFLMLLVGVACLKHEGFQEEKEWRAIYTPQIIQSALMKADVEIVNGVPQHVYKVPLDEAVSPALAGLDLMRILDRIIIGPSPYPWVIYQAFVEELRNAGMADAGNRVFTSGIPIRPGF